MLTVPKLAHQPQLKKRITAPPCLPQHSSSDYLRPISMLPVGKTPKEQILLPNLIKGKENIPITKNDVLLFSSPSNNNEVIFKNPQ